MNADQDIIIQAQRGDHQAFRTLVTRYKDYVYNLSLKMMKNEMEAEEAAQDVFIKVYKGLSGFKSNSKFTTWLYTITFRTCMTRLQKNKPNIVEIHEGHEFHEASPAVNMGMQNLEHEDRVRRIQQALSQLNAKEAAALTLFYLEELSLEETSEVMGLTKSNVKVILFRGRKNMARIVQSSLDQPIKERI